MKIHYIFLFFTLFSFAQVAKQEETPFVFSQETLIKKVIKELHIDESKTDFIVSKVSPSNPKETILVIPEVSYKYEDVFELNSNIVIVDNTTGNITHKYFETSKTNGWHSDAIFIDQIVINSQNFKLNSSKNAFGITVKFRTNSQPNPYYYENISLFTKEKNSLIKIVANYTTYESIGVVNINNNVCNAVIDETFNELSMNCTKTNNYFDILVKKKTTQINYYFDEDGECKPKEKIISIEEKILKYNNKMYKGENI